MAELNELVEKLEENYFDDWVLKDTVEEDKRSLTVWNIAAGQHTDSPDLYRLLRQYDEHAQLHALSRFAAQAQKSYSYKGVAGWDSDLERLFEGLLERDEGALLASRDQFENPERALLDVVLLKADKISSLPEESVPIIAKARLAESSSDYWFKFLESVETRDDWKQTLIEVASSDDEFEIARWSAIEPLVDEMSPVQRISAAKKLKSWNTEKQFEALLRPLGEDHLDKILAAFESLGPRSRATDEFALILMLIARDTGAELPDSVLESFLGTLRSIPNPDLVVEAFTSLPREVRVEFMSRDVQQENASGRLRLLSTVADETPLLYEFLERVLEEDYADHDMPTVIESLAAVGEPMLGPLHDAWDLKLKVKPAEILIRAIGQIGSSESAEVLVEAMGHSSKTVQTEAVQAVESLGGAAREALEAGVDASRKAIRESSALLLERLESSGETPLGDLEARARAFDAATVEAWLEAIDARDWQVRRAAAEEVAEAGAHAFAALRPAFVESLDSRVSGFRELCEKAHQKDDAPESAWVAVDVFACATGLNHYRSKELTRSISRFGASLAAPIVYQLSGPESQQQIQLYELLFEHAPAADVGVLVDGLGNSSKVVRDGCVEALVEHCEPDDYRARVAEKLSARKKDVRQAAAEVLARIDAGPVREEIEAALDKEKTADVSAALEKALEAAGGSAFDLPDEDAAPAELIEFLEGLAMGKLPKFLDLDALPALEFADGKQLDGEALKGFLTRLALEDDGNEDEVVRSIRPHLDDASANAFSVAIKDQWANADASGKDKWAIYQQGVLASDERFNEIAPRLAYLTMNGYHHLAGWYVDLLERNGSKTALSWVLYWVRHAERKSLKSNAQAAWQRAQERRGVSANELEAQLNAYIADDVADAAVPRLDVDEVRRVDYGSREVEIFVDQNLRVHSRDDKDKVRDSMPSARKADEEEKVAAAKAVFSDLKSALDRTKKAVFERLEHAMVTGRPWSKEAFEGLFVDHPLMSRIAGFFIFATDEGQTFRLSEGEYLDPEYGEVALAEDATIRLVHRLNLSDEVAETWEAHLGDAELVPPFAQLDRPTFEPGDVDYDVEVNPGTLAGRLMRLGWRKGRPEDAGMVYEASKLFAGHGVRAELSHGGFYVGDPSTLGDPIKIESVSFRSLDGAFLDQYDAPAIVLSETFYDLARIVEWSS